VGVNMFVLVSLTTQHGDCLDLNINSILRLEKYFVYKKVEYKDALQKSTFKDERVEMCNISLSDNESVVVEETIEHVKDKIKHAIWYYSSLFHKGIQ
jgi:hypothetical protein